MGYQDETMKMMIKSQLVQQLHQVTEDIGQKAMTNNHDALLRIIIKDQLSLLARLIDELSKAGGEYSQELATLIQIDASFSNIQTGNYGLCSDCETPIAKELLEETPYRQRCRTCLTKYLASPNEECNTGIKP